MKLIPVVSSNLKAVGYDEVSRTLEIKFNSGSVYNYLGVSKGIFQKLLAAPSKGQYFWQYIRDKYSYRRIV